MTDLSSYSAANRGAVTTIFTPPASCLTQTTVVSYFTTVSSISGTTSFSTAKIFINHFSWGDSACYPSTIATGNGQTKWGNGYYYSPGVCPSGWTSACNQRTILSPKGFTVVLEAATTGILCCPSSWECVGGTTTLAAHGCSTILTAGQTISSVWFAPTPTPNAVLSIPTSIPASDIGTFSISANTSALCDAVPVLWQNTDIQILAILSSQAAASSTATSASITPSNTSSNTSVPLPGSSSGLSGGAKAAIGVIIPLVLISVAVGIFFFFRRRGRKQAASQVHEVDGAGHHELSGSGGGEWNNREEFEMGAGMTKDYKDNKYGISEADAGNTISEMGSYYAPGPGKEQQQDVIHEMSAGDIERPVSKSVADEAEDEPRTASGMSRDQLLPRKAVGESQLQA